jgi:hypothetical protein
MMKELESWKRHGVLGEKINPAGKRFMTARWRRTWKGFGQDRKAKSRLVARGFQDPRDRGWVETYSGTSNPGQMHTSIVYALGRRWKAAKADVRTAFLQVPAAEELILQLPSDMPRQARKLGFEPGQFHRTKKAVYGTIDAARIFTQTFKEKSKELGWSELADSILVKKGSDGEIVASLVLHIDDMFCFSSDPVSHLRELGRLFELDDPEPVSLGQTATFIGMDVTLARDGKTCLISQESYARGVDTKLSQKEARKQISHQDLRPSEEYEVDPLLQKDQQQTVGRDPRLAQPDAAAASSVFQRDSPKQ